MVPKMQLLSLSARITDQQQFRGLADYFIHTQAFYSFHSIVIFFNKYGTSPWELYIELLFTALFIGLNR
jgi:hypothetical protein